MRLGKTPTTLWWLRTLERPFPALVVAPSNTLQGWAREAEKEGLKARYLGGIPKEQQIEELDFTKEELVLTTYQSLQVTGRRSSSGKALACPTQLAVLPWRTVVLDESTRIRNPKALITRTVRKYLGNVPYKACLSGLPNPEGMLDLVEPMCWLFGSWLGCRNYWEFRNKYFEKKPWGWDWTCSTENRRKIMVSFHEKAVVLARKEVGLKVEPKHVKVVCEMPTELRRVYDKAEKEWTIGGSETAWAPVVASWLLQLAGGFPKDHPKHHSTFKMDALLDLLRDELHGLPVLVWFRHLSELEVAAGLISRSRTLSGSTSQAERRALEKDFKERRFNVLLIQEDCGKFGLDLSVSSHVVHYSHGWSYETYAQLMERTEHPMKNKQTTHIHLLTKDSIDEDRNEACMTKGLLSSSFRSKVLLEMMKRKMSV